MSQAYFETADQYIADLFDLQDAALADVTDQLAAAGISDMSVSPTQGHLLHVLARLCGAVKILEIGTFFGYSSIWLARALPKGGRLLTLEYNPDYAAAAWKNFAKAGLADKVEIQVGSAIDALPQLVASGAGPYDMIFIDADKPPYADYLKWALRLARPGTLIVADNVIRHLYDPATPPEKRQGVEKFNQMIAESGLVTATILQTVGMKDADGMAIMVVNREDTYLSDSMR